MNRLIDVFAFTVMFAPVMALVLLTYDLGRVTMGGELGQSSLIGVALIIYCVFGVVVVGVNYDR